MEIFVFIHVGRPAREAVDQPKEQPERGDGLVVRLLDHESCDLPMMLTRFDAGHARCFLDGDRQKLLAVIETGFGSFAPFNLLVRGMFRGKMEEATTKSKEAAIRWRSRSRTARSVSRKVSKFLAWKQRARRRRQGEAPVANPETYEATAQEATSQAGHHV